MQSYLMDLLVCPRCHGELMWNLAEENADRIERADVHCLTCEAIYKVHDGVGCFLLPELEREDLWEEVDSHLAEYLRHHPETERLLLESPLTDLTPADQFLRAQILEERREYIRAKLAFEAARSGLYTPEHLACARDQIETALHWLSSSTGPVVDLASGMASLVEEMTRKLRQPIVATDVSPLVLRRDRRHLEFFGLYERVSLLAFDARRTPFKDGSIELLTTYQGLQNIRDSGSLLRELRRIVAGSFLALSIFLPDEDHANRAVVEKLGISDQFDHHTYEARFSEAGWRVETLQICSGRSEPTPPSQLLDGVSIDSIPAAGTMLEWRTDLAT